MRTVHINRKTNFRKFNIVTCLLTTASILTFSSCKDDPQPTNEEELITTLQIELTPLVGDEVTLEFFDADGDGPQAPVFTPPVAALKSNTTYAATITLLDETKSPVKNMTDEIAAEKDDHLFCFEVEGTDIAIVYDDEDGNGNPVGISTNWGTGDSGAPGVLKVTLRHQPGTKNGNCPGGGENDIEVTFVVKIVD